MKWKLNEKHIQNVELFWKLFNEMKDEDYNFNQKGFLRDFHGVNILLKKSSL